MNIQTRSETTGLGHYETLHAAFEAARFDPTIWKISFNVKEERIRLVRDSHDTWRYEPINISFAERQK